MSERRFSIVICTDGREQSLRETVRSLSFLDYRNFELCVVCGPTADGVFDWVEAHSSPIKVVRCPVRNISRARNLGIAATAGEIVAFLDDDAIPEPEWLSDLNAAYEDTKVVAAGGVVFDSTGLEFQARFVTTDRLGYAHNHWTRPAGRLNIPCAPEFPHLLGANCSFRRETLIVFGGFDEEYDYFLDETDLLARINEAGGVISQCARAAVHHRCAPSVNRRTKQAATKWGPFIKNRVYFGYRNGLCHTPWEALRAAVDDAAAWGETVTAQTKSGLLDPDAPARFQREAEDAIAEGIAAAREPARKLMRRAPSPPPPFLPFAATVAPEGQLRIALVTQDYPPGHNGGVARHFAELAASLARAGCHVHVFTRARAAPSLVFDNGVWVRRLSLSVDISTAAPPSVPPELWRASHAMFEAVAELDAVRPVDWVYAPLWDAEPIAFLHEPRWPVIVGLQTTLEFWLDSQPAKRRDAEWMRARGAPMLSLERWCLTRAPLLHANSRAILADIARRYDLPGLSARSMVAPHGLSDWASEPTAEEAPSLPDACRFLFVGRLESRKGIDVLAAAAPLVLAAHPGATLDIVGDDRAAREEGKDYASIFRRAAEAHGLGERVRLHGRLGETELRRMYRECDALVAPSRYESFGLVYLEGMIFGKPVIGGAAGGGPEVIEDGVTGLLVQPGDQVALTQAMNQIAADPELRRSMGAAGRRRYEACFQADAAARLFLQEARRRLEQPIAAA